MANVSLDKTPLMQRVARKLAYLAPSPKPQFWWLDFVWVVFFGLLQEVVLPSFLPSLLHIDILTPWLTFNIITRSNSSIFGIYVVTSLLLEGLSSVPAGFYFTVYALPLVVIPIVRSNLTWSFYTPWLICYALALFWVHVFKFFVQAVVANNFFISVHNIVFTLGAIFAGTLIGSIISKPYQSTEYFVKEGIV